MNIRLVCVGKLKKEGLDRQSDLLVKKIGPYAKLEILEFREGNYAASTEKGKEEEARLISRHMGKGFFDIACDDSGEMMSSEKFAEFINKLALHGDSNIQFIVGGPFGLHGDVLSAARKTISFSPMVFNHMLFRIMLLEQIYRSLGILSGSPYHH